MNKSPNHPIAQSLNSSMFLRILAAREFRLNRIGLVLQFLKGANFRAVVGLDDGAFKDSKLLNAVREARTRRTARPSLIGVLGRRPLGQERQDFVLFGAGEPREGFGVFREAEPIKPSQCLEILLLGFSALSREVKINEAVDLGSLRAGRVGRRN